MDRKTLAIFLAPVCAAALLAQGPGGRGPGRGFGGFGGPGGFGWAGPASRTVVTGEPYSATQTVTIQQNLASGNQITRTQQSTVARDSEGRISTSETVTPPASSGKAAYTVESIFDPVGGYRYRLDSATMTAVQAPLPPKRTSTYTPPARPANPNVVTTSLGTAVVNGVSATGTQVTQTIPAGAIGNAQAIQVIRVTWVSTALQIPVEIKTTDPRFGTTDMEVTNIVQSEPDASLFTVPAGYTIKTGKGGPGAMGRGAGAAGRARRGAPPAQF